jgi:hypothetical protein
MMSGDRQDDDKQVVREKPFDKHQWKLELLE